VFDDPKGKKPETPVHTMARAEKNEASTLVVFECRGCEFIGFEARVRPLEYPWLNLSLLIRSCFQGSWTCKGAESGTVFESFEFEDGRWDDYDEKASRPRRICLSSEADGRCLNIRPRCRLPSPIYRQNSSGIEVEDATSTAHHLHQRCRLRSPQINLALL